MRRFVKRKRAEKYLFIHTKRKYLNAIRKFQICLLTRYYVI
ncbi:hypothetical protein HMPREF9123_1731 [Neisseria bacilliformis ATCC BAA-1200]|uniref:Uncharacterized protein n=1 Tax=Neisseria bacilliformis ATCC BAA-1200 TaxID=888742 RepID=F2BDC5_9NEIS|nr:hypothetical protein HMPREF9123_1731 [Neisseria bacilliformis ATCC BAA-1200]